MKVKRAFTLSEILLTLAIIGIVSAITVPVIINNVESMQSKSGNKEIFSLLSSAISQIKQDNGQTLLNMTYSDFEAALANKFTGVSSLSYNSWHSANTWYTLSGSPQGARFARTINNGMLLTTSYTDSNCSTTTYGQPNGQKVCGFIYADINGFQKPNTVGKDIFLYWIFKDGVVPAGTVGDNYLNSCTASSSGWGCAAKYLKE